MTLEENRFSKAMRLQRDPAPMSNVRRFLRIAGVAGFGVFFVLSIPLGAAADSPILVSRTPDSITIDGDLSDAGWKGAARFALPYETWPGENTPTTIETSAYVTYDDRFLYIGIDCVDPRPNEIRAPLVDRDHVELDQDFVDVNLDTRHDHRLGYEFAVNARNVQADGIFDDANFAVNPEDFSPDFFWDSATRITPRGYVIEMRIPFSSLRYSDAEPQTWGITFRRNYNRGRDYRLSNVPWPHNSNCFICHEAEMTGLAGLPQGGHLVVAPYVVAREQSVPRNEGDSSRLNKPIRGDGGVDVKWIPNLKTAVDGTINPDFSQVESDVSQISVNERFALLYPEKRPFFLEGSDLFTTPISAAYTRTITSPRWGLRSTGKLDSNAYTLLVAQDRGGGTVVIPGPASSEFAPQDFSSIAAIGRLRHDFGRSFASFLLTDREIEGGGHNRVLGPDFQLAPSDKDTVAGQFLLSDTETPNRPDLSNGWTGERFSSRAMKLWWWHTTREIEWYAELADVGDGFRADNGFVPQVGYRHAYGLAGYTRWPTDSFLTRERVYVETTYDSEPDGSLINRQVSLSTSMDGPLNSYLRLFYSFEKIRALDLTPTRRRLSYILQMRPSRLFPWIDLEGNVGEQIDFENGRRGHGADILLNASLQPTIHLRLDFNGDRRWLDETVGDRSGRLFTAQVERLKATYNFNASTFLRLIGQYVETRRDPGLYLDSTVPRRDGSLSLSGLFAYKLNWQSVLFVGYGNNRALEESGEFTRSTREFFLKVSYAFQR